MYALPLPRMSEVEGASILLVGIRTGIDFDEDAARYFTEESRAAFMLEHVGFHHDVCCKHLVIERAPRRPRPLAVANRHARGLPITRCAWCWPAPRAVAACSPRRRVAVQA